MNETNGKSIAPKSLRVNRRLPKNDTPPEVFRQRELKRRLRKRAATIKERRRQRRIEQRLLRVRQKECLKMVRRLLWHIHNKKRIHRALERAQALAAADQRAVEPGLRVVLDRLEAMAQACKEAEAVLPFLVDLVAQTLLKPPLGPRWRSR